MRRPGYGSDGFNLIEAIFAVAISALLALGVASQLAFSFQASRSVQENLDFEELVSQVKQLVESPTACKSALSGQTPTVGAPLTLTFPGTTHYALNDSTQSKFGAINIMSMKWTALAPLSPRETIGWFSITADLSNNGAHSIIGGNLKTFPRPGTRPPGIMVDLSVNAGGQITGCSGTKNLPYQYTATIPPSPSLDGTYTIIGFGGPPGTTGNFEFAMGSGTILGAFGTIPLPGASTGGWSYGQTVMNVGINDAYHDSDIWMLPWPIKPPGTGVMSSDGYVLGAGVGVTAATGFFAGGAGGDGHPHYQPGTARGTWNSYSWRVVP